MIEFYVNQINMGRLTIDDVPELWRERVRKALHGEDVEPFNPALTVPNTLNALNEMGVEIEGR